MALRRLRVNNVRSIKEIDVDFSAEEGDRAWSILLGENGTGKTTILRCVALALAGSDALAELLIAPSSWVRNGETSARIEAEFTTRRGEPRKAAIEWSKDDSVSMVIRKNEKNLHDIDAAVEHAERNYFVAAYGSSRRLPSKDSPQMSRSEVYTSRRAQAVATLFSRDAALRPLEAWAMDLEYRRDAEGLSIIHSALDTLLPGVKFAHIDRKEREMMFQTEDGLVSLNQLSDGYQNMAGWIGDLLFRLTETFGDYRDPLSAGGTLLLDEVDLHLHPVWQRQLLTFLSDRLPHFQFVVTTHSPFTAQQSAPGALHIVQRGTNGVQSVRQFEGDPRLLRIDQLLDPILGLTTTESVQSENLRNDYRELKKIDQRDAAQEARLQEVTQQLEEIPQAQALSKEEQDRLALLSRVEKLLTKQQ